MDKIEAEKQLQEIHRIMTSEHRLIGSPTSFIVCGTTVVLLAALHLLNWLRDEGRVSPALFGAATLAILVVVFAVNFGGRRILRDESAQVGTQNAHPSILQTLGVMRAMLLSGAGLTVVWWLHMDRLMIVWMILFGIAMNLWGRFVHDRVQRYSYVLIAGAILIAGLSEFQVFTSNGTVVAALLMLGTWFVGLGYIILKHQQRS